MTRLAALALLVDGVLQIAGLAAVWPTLADRSARDQALFAAHLVTGLALAAAAALVNASSARPTVNSAPSPVARRLTAASLLAALVIALAETTWFNWAGTLARGVYSVVIGGITLRRW